MEHQIYSSIEINASPKKVWEILLDTQNYSQWNPFITKLEGQFQSGGKLEVELGGMNFKPTVKIFETTRHFAWLGHFLIKGIFDGEHHFEIIPNSSGTSTFKHHEKFNGILVGLMKKKLDTEILSQFKAMNEALKTQAEK